MSVVKIFNCSHSEFAIWRSGATSILEQGKLGEQEYLVKNENKKTLNEKGVFI